MSVVLSSVPNPDPPDPHVSGPPGCESIRQIYGSGSIRQIYESGSIRQMYGSESFYHQAKKVRKTLIPTFYL